MKPQVIPKAVTPKLTNRPSNSNQSISRKEDNQLPSSLVLLDKAIEKCFLISGALRGKGYDSLSGNFDKQGISFGILQWCLGQGSLQPLLTKMYETDNDAFRMACTVWVPLYKKPLDLTDRLLEACQLPPDKAVEWSNGRQDKMFRLYPHWTIAFQRLGAEPKFQAVQRQKASNFTNRAVSYCEEFDLKTERALVLFFDCCIQQGGIKPLTKTRILESNFEKADYQSKLDIIAEAMSTQAKDIAQREVLARRMCIARNGGIVREIPFNLKRDFNVTDEVIF